MFAKEENNKEKETKNTVEVDYKENDFVPVLKEDGTNSEIPVFFTKEDITTFSISDLYHLGKEANDHQQWLKALRYLEELVKRNSEHRDGRFELAYTYTHSGKIPLAIELLKKLLQSEPANGFIMLQMGKAHEEQGKIKDAKEWYNKAIKYQPIDAYSYLGFLCLSNAQYSEAIKYYQKIVAIEPRDSNAWYNLGLIHLRLGDHGKARIYFEKSYEIDPNSEDVKNNLITVYHALGEHKLAQSLNEKQLKK